MVVFMAHLHKKMKKGRPYYYIREIARVGGKPKVVNQIYLGSIERLAELAQGASGRCQKIAVQEFGALFIANLIEEHIGVASIIDAVLPRVGQERGPSLGEYFLYAVFNRMVDACSKNLKGGSYGKDYQEHRPPFQRGDSGKDQDNSGILAGAKMAGYLECPG